MCWDCRESTLPDRSLLSSLREQSSNSVSGSVLSERNLHQFFSFLFASPFLSHHLFLSLRKQNNRLAKNQPPIGEEEPALLFSATLNWFMIFLLVGLSIYMGVFL